MPEATVHSINVSDGGVPKHPRESAAIRANGVEGDSQRDLRHHGGPDRAVVLYSLERIEALRGEGHPIEPGSIGENLTLRGVDWATLTPGARLQIGETLLEIVEPADPCKKIAGSFLNGEFARVSEKVNPGWSRLCSRVLREGTVKVGDQVSLASS
jgi:MOSC domain-containing protein YiiM